MGTPLKWGREFLVNTTTGNYQGSPSITALADGRFVVAWTALSLSVSGRDVRAQVFNADGSYSGAEFLVNTTTGYDQREPTITALADGRFVVAWTDDSQTGLDSSSYAVRAQVFNADGSHAGAEFLVNTTTQGPQLSPSITALADGRFVVAWSDQSQYAILGTEVRAQVFNADGSHFGAEFPVNTTTKGWQFLPRITALADGRFVVAWDDDSQSGGDRSGFAVRAQVFNADGTNSGAEFLVNTTKRNDQYVENITALADGRFVVAWTDDSQTGGDTSLYAVRAQVFNADGSHSGAEFLVNTTTQGYQIDPSITALADGRFVVAWMDNSQTGGDTSLSAVRAQVFNADGSYSGAEFLVNTITLNDQAEPGITALADGRFVVAWTNYNSVSSDVRAQIFDPREAAVDLSGTGLSDDFVGTIFDDQMRGWAGDDRLVGKFGNDLLIGDVGNDDLQGRVGADSLTGGGGNDTLAGGGGDDVLTGGSGGDTFIFAKGGGHDVITDFADGLDRIDLSSFGFATFAAAQAYFTTSGADLVFTKGAVVLTLHNFTLAELSPGDLIL